MKKKTKEYSKETYRRAFYAACRDLVKLYSLTWMPVESYTEKYKDDIIAQEMATRLKEADTIYE